jgi:hypothetical protein
MRRRLFLTFRSSRSSRFFASFAVKSFLTVKPREFSYQNKSGSHLRLPPFFSSLTRLLEPERRTESNLQVIARSVKEVNLIAHIQA